MLVSRHFPGGTEEEQQKNSYRGRHLPYKGLFRGPGALLEFFLFGGGMVADRNAIYIYIYNLYNLC